MAELSGLDELFAQLDTIGSGADDAAYNGTDKAVRKIRDTAKRLVPVKTEALRDSIYSVVTVEGTDIVGTVGTNSDHAAYVEFGTGQRGGESPAPPKYDGNVAYKADWPGMPAQPFLFPAAEENKDNVINDIAGALKDAIEEAGHG
jgi:HK97 gp10 family phage protein